MLGELFVSFFKIGLFTFGGGYAMLPLIEKELVEKKKWITQEELLEMYVISQMTPGTIAINASTFIGNQKFGKVGGFIASLGIICPSLVIITLIYKLGDGSFNQPIVKSIFFGIRACIIALVLNSVLKVCRSSFHSIFNYFIFIGSFIFLLCFNVNPITLIVLGGILGWMITVCFPNKISKILEEKK